MSAFNLRPRQIDVDKSMPIMFGEIPEEELDSSHTRGMVEVNVSNMPVEEEQEKHLREILGNSRSASQVEAIPTPNVQHISSYDEEIEKFPLVKKSSYIRYSDIESNIDHVEYDMDEIDEAFLDDLSSSQGINISYDDFEYLIDFMEKQNHLYPQFKCDIEYLQQQVVPHLRSFVPIVHSYWQNRINTEGRPLLRRFLNHAIEKSPYEAFVIKTPTIPTNMSKKKTLDDERVYDRLVHLKQQFLQMRVLLHTVIKREKLKLEKAIVTRKSFELLLNLAKEQGANNLTLAQKMLLQQHFGSGVIHPTTSINAQQQVQQNGISVASQTQHQQLNQTIPNRSVNKSPIHAGSITRNSSDLISIAPNSNIQGNHYSSAHSAPTIPNGTRPPHSSSSTPPLLSMMSNNPHPSMHASSGISPSPPPPKHGSNNASATVFYDQKQGISSPRYSNVTPNFNNGKTNNLNGPNTPNAKSMPPPSLPHFKSNVPGHPNVTQQQQHSAGNNQQLQNQLHPTNPISRNPNQQFTYPQPPPSNFNHLSNKNTSSNNIINTNNGMPNNNPNFPPHQRIANSNSHQAPMHHMQHQQQLNNARNSNNTIGVSHSQPPMGSSQSHQHFMNSNQFSNLQQPQPPLVPGAPTHIQQQQHTGHHHLQPKGSHGLINSGNFGYQNPNNFNSMSQMSPSNMNAYQPHSPLSHGVPSIGMATSNATGPRTLVIQRPSNGTAASEAQQYAQVNPSMNTSFDPSIHDHLNPSGNTTQASGGLQHGNSLEYHESPSIYSIPPNLLRSYPYIGGNKKQSATINSQPPNAPPNVLKHSSFSKKINAIPVKSLFSNPELSPLIDPFTKMRHDEYRLEDNDQQQLEEMESELDMESDPVLLQLAETSQTPILSNRYQPIASVTQSAVGMAMNRTDNGKPILGFSALPEQIPDDFMTSYNSSDSIYVWNKEDSLLTHHLEEQASRNSVSASRDGALKNEAFAMKIPASATSYQQSPPSNHSHTSFHISSSSSAEPTKPLKTLKISIIPSKSKATHPPAPSLSKDITSLNKKPLSSSCSSNYQTVIVPVELPDPYFIPKPREGYRLYYAPPNVQVQPRTYQTKCHISPTSVNGIPFPIWTSHLVEAHLKSDSEFSLSNDPTEDKDNSGAHSRIPHDSTIDHDGHDEPSSIMKPPMPKRIRLAQPLGSNVNAYVSVDADALEKTLPSSVYYVNSHNSYDVVEAGGPYLKPFNGRKRLDSSGRIVWDRKPLSLSTSQYFNQSFHRHHLGGEDILLEHHESFGSHIPSNSAHPTSEETPSTAISEKTPSSKVEHPGILDNLNSNNHSSAVSNATSAIKSPESNSGETTVYSGSPSSDTRKDLYSVQLVQADTVNLNTSSIHSSPPEEEHQQQHQQQQDHLHLESNDSIGLFNHASDTALTAAVSE